MNSDLFQTKRDSFICWCKWKGVFSKADAMNYGLNNFYLRADRELRQLVRDGVARKIDFQECQERNLSGKMAWYEWVEK